MILINLFSNVKWQFCVYSFFVQNINFDLQFCAVGKWENGEASEVVVGRGGGGERMVWPKSVEQVSGDSFQFQLYHLFNKLCCAHSTLSLEL